MKVTLGGFGDSVAGIAPIPSAAPIYDAAGGAINQAQRALDQVQRNREALQRAKATNAVARYQLNVEETGRQLEEDIASGTVDYEKANEEYATRTAKIPTEPVTLDNAIDQENHSAGMKYAQERGRLSLAPHIFAARQRDGVAQLDDFLDTQAKRAIEPGADVEAINKSADGFAANARVYGLPEDVISRKVQGFKDSNWFNSAMQRAVEADQDVRGLRSVLHDLTAKDGIYASKLDPEKRNALQASVQSKIDRIEMRAEAHANQQEAKGDRAITQIERQISSGIPATPEMWGDWATTVKGTSAEAEFKDLVASEQEVQDTLRKPVGEQLRLVQEKQAALLNGGGTVAQGANVQRLTKAVDSNIKLLTQNPVVFGEERLGDKNQPIDIGQMFDEQGQHDTAATLQERATRIRALGKQFGALVPMRPLLPQEAKQLASVMESGSPKQVTDLYAALYASSGSPDVYRGAMMQIAPDSPVRASAGLLAGLQRELTTRSHWFKPDESVTSRDVSATMLEGDRILNRSSTAKAEDGKAQTKLVLPETKLLQAEFANQIGLAYAGRPQAAEAAFQDVQAYYAGRIAQTGKIAAGTDDVDTNLVREAVKATQGAVVDYNGRGDVLAPWGMSEGDFIDRAHRELFAEAKRRGLPELTPVDLSFIGLTNTDADGVYAIVTGRKFMRDKAGQVVTINLAPPDARDAHGYINRTP